MEQHLMFAPLVDCCMQFDSIRIKSMFLSFLAKKQLWTIIRSKEQCLKGANCRQHFCQSQLPMRRLLVCHVIINPHLAE